MKLNNKLTTECIMFSPVGYRSFVIVAKVIFSALQGLVKLFITLSSYGFRVL